LAQAMALAEKVVALPPIPVRMSKQAVNAHANAMNYTASYMDREQYTLVTGSEGNKKAVQKFLERSKTNK
jgi:enoyl-CoA hydratase/carnithine racemase